MVTSKRILKELNDLSIEPLEGIEVELCSEDEIKNWRILMTGPKGSPYEGGVFQLLLRLPDDYPFKPPTLSFETKIYHPNVSNDDKGSMCLGILGKDWMPSSKIATVLDFAKGLLLFPQPDNAVEGGIAQEFLHSREEFDKNAEAWTKRHAAKAKDPPKLS